MRTYDYWAEDAYYVAGFVPPLQRRSTMPRSTMPQQIKVGHLKPMEVTAYQWTGDYDDATRIVDWVNHHTPGFDKNDSSTWRCSRYYSDFRLRTWEGELIARPKDWIVRFGWGNSFHLFTDKEFQELAEVEPLA